MKVLKAILITALIFISIGAFAQTTTIWVVRHAEKENTPGNDPDLSAEGKARAIALADQLKNEKIAAVFSTDYKRTRQTGEPVLKQAGLTEEKIYNPADVTALTKQVLQEYIGKSVLIVGHSNTIVPTLQAFGAEKPFDTLDDDDYDQLFKITVNSDKKVRLEIKQYGAVHHNTKAVRQNKMMQLN